MDIQTDVGPPYVYVYMRKSAKYMTKTAKGADKIAAYTQYICRNRSVEKTLKVRQNNKIVKCAIAILH